MPWGLSIGAGSAIVFDRPPHPILALLLLVQLARQARNSGFQKFRCDHVNAPGYTAREQVDLANRFRIDLGDLLVFEAAHFIRAWR